MLPGACLVVAIGPVHVLESQPSPGASYADPALCEQTQLHRGPLKLVISFALFRVSLGFLEGFLNFLFVFSCFKTRF